MNKNQIETSVAQEVRALIANIEVDCSIEKFEQVGTTVMDELKAFKINSGSYEEEFATITESMELLNVQIADLGQKILVSRQDNIANVRKAIHTVGDAKIAYETALEIITQDRRQQCRKFNDLKGECQNLQAQLEEYQKRESESKTSTLQDRPNTSNAETSTKSNEHSQNVKTELEDQVTMLVEKDLENATVAGLELERMQREVLSSDNEVNPLAQSMEDLQARLDAQQATNALNLKTQEDKRRNLQAQLEEYQKRESESKTSTSQDRPNTSNAETSTKSNEHSQNVKTVLEDQVTMLVEKVLENATVAVAVGLELERMQREVLSSDNEVNPLEENGKMNKNQIERRAAQEVRALMANIEVDRSIEKLEQCRTTLMDGLKEIEINSSSYEEEFATITESMGAT